MSTQQEILQNHLPQIENWIKEYLPEDKQFDELKTQINHFIVRLPLIGAFSSGKSTVLNALIGKKMLATAIKPETSIPTELCYNANSQRIIVNFGDGKTEEIDTKQLKRQKDLEVFANKGAWLEVDINQEHWASFPHLCLVDFPGLDSGNKIHNLAIDQYLGRSLAYAVVISLKDGDIVETTKEFLQSLSTEEKPVIIIFTRADQLSEKDREAVIEKMLDSVRKILQKEPMAIVIPDIDDPKKTREEIVSILNKIEEEEIEKIFRHHVGIPVIDFLNHLKSNNIDVLANNENSDPEGIAEQIRQLQMEMAKFENNSEKSRNRFQSDLEETIIYIKEDIKGALQESVPRLTDLAIDNRDIKPTIENIVRNQLKKSITKRYNPLVKNFIEEQAQFIPSEIQVRDPQFQNPLQSMTFKDDVSFSSTISSLLQHIPIFGGLLGGVVGTVIGEIFGRGKSAEEKRIEARERHYQNVNNDLRHHTIPEIIEDLENKISALIFSTVDDIRDKFSKKIEKKVKDKEKALKKLQEHLEKRKEEFEQQRKKYQQDSKAVHNLISLLEKS